MGETRVDLVHLLQDLRDAYVDPIEETILSEAIANSLDSRASVVSIDLNPDDASITIRDNGSGMGRSELRRYHDLARSSKERGEGIGFAGVGIKLGLLISNEVWTESGRAGRPRIATNWRLASKHKAPWRFCDPFGAAEASGTMVRLFLKSPLSPLLDRGFVEAAVRRHFEALFEPHLYRAFSARYPDGVTFELGGHVLDSHPRRDATVVEVRLPRKKKPAGVGLMWRSAHALPEDRQGIAISTFGKVIKRGWDWLGVSPPSPERVGGLIELPALAEALTLNKGDFIRSGARGSLYLICRKALQEAVVDQLEAWGEDTAATFDAARRKAARPFERDLAGVLEGLSVDYPTLASLVDHRASKGGRKLRTVEAAGTSQKSVWDADTAESSETEAPVSSHSAPGLSNAATPGPGDEAGAADSNAVLPLNLAADAMDTALLKPTRKAGRYGLTLAFESRPEDESLGHLVENSVSVNVAHPAYRRAETTRALGYHLALVSAMSLARIAVEPNHYNSFVTDFLKRWGTAAEGRTRSRR